MNTLGLSMLVKMGWCPCSKEFVYINNNKYQIRELVGDGGFASVYMVEHARNKKLFAVKKIVCHSLEEQRLAMDEIAYHRLLSHPNVIPCLEYALTDEGADPILFTSSVVYMLLPLYRRGTLAEELRMREKRNLPMTCADILNMFLQICDGLKMFHDHKPEPLAHHDLKPANILLGDDNTPVITDLGSTGDAKMKIDSVKDARNIRDKADERCSMPYRAPEFFTVDLTATIDQRSDIWSLGCVLYAMCFFKSPFDYVYERGDSVALAVVSGKIQFPSSSAYPQAMHDLIISMLKLNPTERPYIEQVILKTKDVFGVICGSAEC